MQCGGLWHLAGLGAGVLIGAPHPFARAQGTVATLLYQENLWPNTPALSSARKIIARDFPCWQKARYSLSAETMRSQLSVSCSPYGWRAERRVISWLQVKSRSRIAAGKYIHFSSSST